MPNNFPAKPTGAALAVAIVIIAAQAVQDEKDEDDRSS